jgi:hypothetical protein
MSESIFLKPADFYQRNINPIAQYIDQNAFYLSKMTGKDKDTCSDIIKQGLKANKSSNIKNPTVHFFERDENGDRYKTECSLSQYIGSVVARNYIMVPTGTVYVRPEEKRSLLVDFIEINKKIRSVAKKEAQIAEAAGDTVKFIMKNNEQDNRKRYNNSTSGAMAAEGNILNNPTGHSTLTTITRTIGSLGNASNEKVIAGNRHYRNPQVTLANVISITSTLEKDKLEAVMSKYNLHYPSVDETMECINRSFSMYSLDMKALSNIRLFVEKLLPIERAGFVYGGDLFHIRKHNEAFIRDFITKLSTKVKDVRMEDPYTYLKKADELVVNYAHQICMTEVKGIGKDYTKIDPEQVQWVAATTENIQKVVLEYKDFIDVIFLTRNIPASTAYIPNMVRRSVVLSDTDSTMFSIDEWVNWYFGGVIFTPEAFAVAGAVMYIATQCIAHSIAIFSANMNVERSKLFLLAMKPEFVFDVFCQTPVAKHYFTNILVKEGNVYKKKKPEIKGVNLKNSAAPKVLIDDSQEHMSEIMETVSSGKKISMVNELTRVANIERKIEERLLNDDTDYYKSSKIKVPEAYVKGPEQSVYQFHICWTEVFGPKYGTNEVPPYGIIKIPTVLKNKTAIKNWIDSIQDRALAERLQNWIIRKNKTVLKTFYISKNYIKANGIPIEIKSVIDLKRLVLDLTGTDRMILETLGYCPKPGWLIREQTVY